MSCGKLPQAVQHFLRQAGAADPDPVILPGNQHIDIFPGGLHFPEDQLAGIIKTHAGFVQPDLFAVSVKKGNAQFGFQPLDLLGKSRLGDVQIISCFGDILQVSYCIKVTKVQDVHRIASCCAGSGEKPYSIQEYKAPGTGNQQRKMRFIGAGMH